MASTPGHADLFPDDATPINILPRLLNAYFDADLPLAREDSYWVDWRTLRTRGILALESADDLTDAASGADLEADSVSGHAPDID